MSFQRELAAAFAGSLALLRADADAMRHFDVSVAGFWRSFLVAVVLAPTLLVDIAVDGRLAAEVGAADTGVAARLLTYAAGFVVFPLLLAPLARPLGLSATYVPFIVARNWTSLVGIIPTLAAALAYLAGLYGREALALANFAALIFNLFYAYRVARLAAAVPPGQASGLVALDFVLMLIAGTLIVRL
jgi:hypothetical protein